MERHQELTLAGDVPQEAERAGAHQRTVAAEHQQLAGDPPAKGTIETSFRPLAHKLQLRDRKQICEICELCGTSRQMRCSSLGDARSA